MKIQHLFASIGFFLCYILLTFFLSWHTDLWLRVSIEVSSLLFLFPLFLFLSFSFFIGEMTKISFFRILGFFWFGIFYYAVLICLVADISYLVLSLFADNKEKLIFFLGILSLLFLSVLLLKGCYNAYSPVVRLYAVPISKPSANWKTLRIAMASDMHFGTLSGLRHARRMVSVINSTQPDLVLLAGDLIDDDPVSFIQKKIGEELKHLSSSYGTYGILGNHDYYGKKSDEVLDEMKKARIHMLTDTSVLIEDSLYLIGRKDKHDSHRLPFPELLSSLDTSLPLIAIDHQPTDISLAADIGIDLLLSGHTHRGQMAPNHFITKRLFENDWGLLTKNQFHSIVSSGFGFWGPPLRIGSRSEIVQIDITFTNAQKPKIPTRGDS